MSPPARSATREAERVAENERKEGAKKRRRSEKERRRSVKKKECRCDSTTRAPTAPARRSPTIGARIWRMQTQAPQQLNDNEEEEEVVEHEEDKDEEEV